MKIKHSMLHFIGVLHFLTSHDIQRESHKNNSVCQDTNVPPPQLFERATVRYYLHFGWPKNHLFQQESLTYQAKLHAPLWGKFLKNDHSYLCIKFDPQKKSLLFNQPLHPFSKSHPKPRRSRHWPRARFASLRQPHRINSAPTERTEKCGPLEDKHGSHGTGVYLPYMDGEPFLWEM